MNGLMMLWDGLIDWAANGLVQTTWWQIVLVMLVLTHITIVSVTVFLHRAQAHRSLDLHALPAHFFRLWLWLTTGMVTKQWVAIHRKHHAKCETIEDPHSPQTRGIKAVLLTGSELYRAESKNPDTLAKYGQGTPEDWLERNLYTRHSVLGVALMMTIDLLLFGAIGAAVWAVQMIWIPVSAAGVINGLGHWWGYRNFEVADASTNISPWGIIIGGEELHNNHHTYPTSAKMSVKPYEFDIGWMYIQILKLLGLASVRKTPPTLKWGSIKSKADRNTLEALIVNRYEVMAKYAAGLRAMCRHELKLLKAAGAEHSPKWAEMRLAQRWLHRDDDKIPVDVKPQLAKACERSPALAKLVTMREELRLLWTRTNVSAEQLVLDLQVWCHEAEQSGIVALQEFALSLRAARA
ncbi:MAG: fatty acid desaturase [Burkholderiaceae bacterium]|nr:fatty acid desaturase [Burkholderiaceae bacterium]MDH3460170.1 fatty acid desaturase [Burkholderiaceae bacterium]